MRKEGGKYAHLNEDLHLMIEVYSEISDSYARLSHALSEVQKYLTPVSCLRQELIKSRKQRLETYCFCSVSYYSFSFLSVDHELFLGRSPELLDRIS